MSNIIPSGRLHQDSYRQFHEISLVMIRTDGVYLTDIRGIMYRTEGLVPWWLPEELPIVYY